MPNADIPLKQAATAQPYLGRVRATVASWLVRLISKRFGLPAVTVSALSLERNIAVTMSDGTPLLTDIWSPLGVATAPVVLVRTPYGRGGLQGMLVGATLAHQGYRVVMQSCRGTDGSGGAFEPFQDEAADAQTAVAWLREQSWFNGKFATYGASYVGYTQWALAANPPPELVAMVVSVAPINPGAFIYTGGVLAYQVLLTWIGLMPDPPPRLQLMFTGKRRRAEIIRNAANSLPLKDGYVAANRGRRSKFFETCLDRPDTHHPWWTTVDHSGALQRVNVPVLMIAGWHDLYAADMVGQFQTLRDRHVDTALLMGATTHAGYVRSAPTTLPETLSWLRAAFAGERPALAGQVRAQKVGGGEWQRFDNWPPSATPYRLHLQPQGLLSDAPAETASVARYRYDPADPTPSIGGDLLAMAADEDSAPLIQRRDVLGYSTAPLTQDLVIGGAVSLELWFSSSSAQPDLFARLCDVTPDGRWMTVCDSVHRLAAAAPGDIPRKIELSLGPTLCRFATGHRIGLLISSGAHPRFLRNAGTDGPLATSTRLVASEQALYLGPEHSSTLVLPRLVT